MSFLKNNKEVKRIEQSIKQIYYLKKGYQSYFGNRISCFNTVLNFHCGYEVYGVDGISDYYSNNKYYDYDIRTYDKDSIREKYEYIQTNSEIKLLKIKIYL